LPLSLLLNDTFDSVSRAKLIKSKTLILLAENDNVIPHYNSTRLINAFSPLILEMLVIKNSGHNSLSATDAYNEKTSKFMQ
jgi:esterase/lipase